MTEHAEWSEPEAGPAPATAAVTPADAADAARLVAFGLQPELQPARDQEYTELLRRYREDPPFARLADAVAAGLGLAELDASPRAGIAVTPAEAAVFAVRMGDYARRTSADGGDRIPDGLAHLAVAAMAFPRPEDLADDGYIRRVSGNGVDAPGRQACRRLEERAEEQGENTDPATDAPALEAAWPIWVRRSATGATEDARGLARRFRAPDADPARAALADRGSAAHRRRQTAVAAWDTAREASRRATEHAREAEPRSSPERS
ncbi:hypothetical protein SALBM311S_01599 [Streptomyces alboniger]